jgi:hypothetical protein
VFSLPLVFSDRVWGASNERAQELARSRDEYEDEGSIPQHASNMALSSYMDEHGPVRPSLISVGKLYRGQLNPDDEESLDFIVWRKLYESREISDPIEGYSLQEDTFLHYKVEDGAFVEQNTDDATIASWLEGAGLRWVDGFPSRSECQDQEGKAIRTFHKQIYNDPDVFEGVDPETLTVAEEGEEQ